MSRSLGLREDQRVGEVLATLIFELFPVDTVNRIREQARAHTVSAVSPNHVSITGQMWKRARPRSGPAPSVPF